MLLNDGDRIVFTGDSITDCNRLRPLGEGLFSGVGDGFVRQVDNFLNVMYPEKYFWITNTGIGGETSRGLRDRWQTDVLDLKPDWVNVMIGMNDIWRKFDMPAIRSYHISIEEYRDNVSNILERTVPAVKGVILMSPYYMETNRNDQIRQIVDQYIDICADLAKQYNCHYINIQNAFDDYLKYRHATYISYDHVHPGPIGSLIIAREFLKAIGVDRAFL